jgi:hypothetical protein
VGSSDCTFLMFLLLLTQPKACPYVMQPLAFCIFVLHESSWLRCCTTTSQTASERVLQLPVARGAASMEWTEWRETLLCGRSLQGMSHLRRRVELEAGMRSL